MRFFAVALGAASLAGLLRAESRGDRRGIWVFKPLASLAFVLYGAARYDGTGYAALILAGLVLGLLGDVFLIPESRISFLVGLGFFLLGHVAYACAFASRATIGPAFAPVLIGVGLVTGLILRWLWPKLGGMRIPVVVYMLVISNMAACAWVGFLRRGGPLVAAGATLFYLSDVSVAKNRFVRRSFLNKAWGLPFYYAGQFLIAATM
jgi:uncharacterized membrane protein YhhN